MQVLDTLSSIRPARDAPLRFELLLRLLEVAVLESNCWSCFALIWKRKVESAHQDEFFLVDTAALDLKRFKVGGKKGWLYAINCIVSIRGTYRGVNRFARHSGGRRALGRGISPARRSDIFCRSSPNRGSTFFVVRHSIYCEIVQLRKVTHHIVP